MRQPVQKGTTLTNDGRDDRTFGQGHQKHRQVQLARLVQNIVGVFELVRFRRTPGRHVGCLAPVPDASSGHDDPDSPQLARADPAAACRFGWFIDRRMRQYLGLCARARHVDDLNTTALLDFGPARQQLEGGNFAYPLSACLRDKVGRRPAAASPAWTAPPTSTNRTATRTSNAADAVINPQKDRFETNSNDKWQVFVDLAGSAPIPNMCCRWHLNGECVKGCFNAASHVPLDDSQIAEVKIWIDKCRARTPLSTADARPKPKLGTSDSVYLCSLLVASSSHSTVRPVTHYRTPTDIRSSPFRLFDHSRRGTPHTPSCSLAATPATRTTPPRPLLSSTPRPAEATLATSTVPLTPATAAPMRRQDRSSICSFNFARPPDEARSPLAATLPGLHARWADPAIASTQSPAARCRCRSHRRPPYSHPCPRRASPWSSTPFSHLSPSEFRFEWSAAAAAHNWASLRRYDLDLGAALRAPPFSTLTIGSEFCQAHLLAPLLSSHSPRHRFADRITAGTVFPLRDISDAARLLAVRVHLARGNHKPAQTHEQQLISMLKGRSRRKKLVATAAVLGASHPS
jgi:hypothetical protein